MSDDSSYATAETAVVSETAEPTFTEPAIEPTASESPPAPPSSDSSPKIKSAIASLSSILDSIPPAIFASQDPAFSLLHDLEISSQISALLRRPDSGAGDNNLCRWFYDTFQSSTPELQLIVLRFLPIIAGLYLSRVSLRKPQAGFEAILLALYAHETTSRNGQSITVIIPDLSHPSIYHESKEPSKNIATERNMAVISASLEPHGTVRSTRRARIVGVALELYYSKIGSMPLQSKVELCEICESWSGMELREESGETKEKMRGGGRIPLPWELLQPALRILGHCLLGPKRDGEVFSAAGRACGRLYERAVHDMDSKAILASGSLHRLFKIYSVQKVDEVDHTEIAFKNVISL